VLLLVEDEPERFMSVIGAVRLRAWRSEPDPDPEGEGPGRAEEMVEVE
jgi:hypothetical protein